MGVVPETSAGTQINTGTSNVANIPSGVVNGDLLAYFYFIQHNSKYLLVPTGWDGEIHFSVSGTAGVGVVWKDADGTETGTQEFPFSATSSSAGGNMVRFSGADTADPFDSDNSAQGEAGSNIDPWTLSADELTNVDSGNIIVTCWGSENGNRNIVTLDSDLTLINSITGGVTGFTHHCTYEASPGTGNAAYSTDMSSARDYIHFLVEIKAAAVGGEEFLGRQYPQGINRGIMRGVA